MSNRFSARSADSMWCRAAGSRSAARRAQTVSALALSSGITWYVTRSPPAAWARKQSVVESRPPERSALRVAPVATRVLIASSSARRTASAPRSSVWEASGSRHHRVCRARPSAVSSSQWPVVSAVTPRRTGRWASGQGAPPGASRRAARTVSSSPAPVSRRRGATPLAATVTPPVTAVKICRTPATEPCTRVAPSRDTARWKVPGSRDAIASTSCSERSRPSAAAVAGSSSRVSPSRTMRRGPAATAVTSSSSQSPTIQGRPDAWSMRWAALSRPAGSAAAGQSGRTTNSMSPRSPLGGAGALARTGTGSDHQKQTIA